MSINIDMSVDVDIACEICGNDLKVWIRDSKYGKGIIVEPCGKCVEEARDAGYNEGYDAGYVEGQDDK